MERRQRDHPGLEVDGRAQDPAVDFGHGDRAEVGGVRIAELVDEVGVGGRPGAGPAHGALDRARRSRVCGRTARSLPTTHDREATYYLGLLMNVYCHADAAEQARWFGDDLSLKGDLFELLGMGTAQTISFLLRRIGSHGGGQERARRNAAFRLAGLRQVVDVPGGHTRRWARSSPAGSDWATRSAVAMVRPMSSGTARAHPRHLRGEEISCRPGSSSSPVRSRCQPPPGRRGELRRNVRKNRGTAVRPDRRRTCSASTRGELLDGLDEAASWDAVLDAEPRWLAGSRDRTWTTSCRRWPTWSTEVAVPGRPLAGGGEPRR